MAKSLDDELNVLRPIRTWASIGGPGMPRPWRRTEDVWDLPAPPEDYALQPLLAWTESLRRQALSEYDERFAKYLDPGEHHEISWPPRGSLTSPGAWYANDPICPIHDDDLEDGCEQCSAAEAAPSIEVDRPASWEWTVDVRVVTADSLNDGALEVYDDGEDPWLLGFTDVDPREVEYGPEQGTGERAELVMAFTNVLRGEVDALRYHRASDADGSRHLIVDTPGLDCSGWRLEAHEHGRTDIGDFFQTQVYGTGSATNLTGLGAPRTAWVALMEWGSEEGALLLPDGSRHELSLSRRLRISEGQVAETAAPREAAAPWQDFDLVMRASAYAADVHRDDVRKGTTVPYLSHLWSVAALVMEHGGDDEQVAAALLHDAAEDHGGAPRVADIAERFGAEVARLVEALSDSLADTDGGEVKAPWRERKQTYLAHLAGVDARVALVSACDKLHNARAIEDDLRHVGSRLWGRFTVTDPAEHLWYYSSLAATLRPKVPRPLAEALHRTVASIEALATE